MHKQSLLPGFPEGAHKIGIALRILEKDDWVTYFVGGDNYYSHRKDDLKGRRFALSSLMANGHVRVCDLEREPLLIPHRTLMNWLTQYRTDGPSSFYRTIDHSPPRVMTPAKSAECAGLLAAGLSPAEVARRASIKETTLNKARQRKAIPRLPEDVCDDCKKSGSTKTERSHADAEAANGLGTACTRADERVATAMGLAECATARFESGCDIHMAGLLAGLPALCASGLLSGLGKYHKLPKGFYSALHILLTLGFMALGRIRRPEGLRHVPPGEFGKVIGLDRVPEVRTLREKISTMAATGNPGAWMQELSKTWMEEDPAEAGYLYVDGHVRVYSGDKANLPHRYVSRDRLCLRGTTDYWVNDALGRPFFVVSKAVTEGLADSLLKDIVPELLTSVPQQPTIEELNNDPRLHRFVIVFDREGATHSLLEELWKLRIGALTYRKNVKDTWPENDFLEQDVPIPGGGSTRMKLAMRETHISAGKAILPVTEVRKLSQTGHQTAIITTAQKLGNTVIASRMFSRWCQENFFAYMMQHYDIDGLVGYGSESLPGTLSVINPAWRSLDKEINKTRQLERKLQVELSKQTMGNGTDIQKQAESVEAIQVVQTELAKLRAERKELPKKVTINSLPEAQRPTQLLPLNKTLTDAVKMIAYRAETAMVAILKRYLNKEDEARALIRELFVSSGDIEPDETAKKLTIRIHRMASPVHDRAVAGLLGELNQQEFCHPETGAKMVYTLA
jgi:hypothetical protein